MISGILALSLYMVVLETKLYRIPFYITVVHRIIKPNAINLHPHPLKTHNLRKKQILKMNHRVTFGAEIIFFRIYSNEW